MKCTGKHCVHCTLVHLYTEGNLAGETWFIPVTLYTGSCASALAQAGYAVFIFEYYNEYDPT